MVGRKGVPIVYDRPTNPKTFSLQKKKAEIYSFQTSKQNHNGNIKYQAVLLNLYSTIIFAEKKTMDCPRCGSINHRKDGIVGGRQRHYCKDCHYRYTVQQKSNTKSAATRRLALEMYLEGLGFRAIGRILKISHTIVYYWVKEWGERVALPQKEGPVSVVELDEMHTYIGSKKTTVGYGLLLIDLENDLSLLSVGREAQIQG